MSTTSKGAARGTGSGAAVVARASVRHLKGSAQKTRLVADEIRGKRVNEARAYLRTCRRAVAADLLKLLQSAVANSEQADDASLLDPDELRVSSIQVDRGPMAKRIQPAPMGRAYRIQKRTCHVTLELGSSGKA